MMKIAIFGTTGMVGRGVLRECLLASDVTQVTVIGRTRVMQTDPKLRQVILSDLEKIQDADVGWDEIDACFFCLGVSSSGMSEAAYSHLTYDITLAVATLLAHANPQMIFTYVSGAGTDSTERGKSMWARVKGRTENALTALPFSGVYLFRPGVIQPLHGIKSKTASYRVFYSMTKPLLPIARALFPNVVLTTEDIGRAMLNAARRGAGRVVLETKDIARLAR
jgi:uncharacterized protein YbjT (DUF2867 family)